LQKDKYNVTKLLNTLQKRGYVQRKMDKEDKRSNFVVLTEKGVESRHAWRQIVEQVHTDISFTLSPQEWKSAIWVLKKLNLQ
ncbi:winged helix DNA-binding protein, partial [Campylobacter jejuni]|nr:winged helix DNA-binding protein [Campylobacter jejuni]